MALFSGCNDDFLERYPLSELAPENYFQSENELKTYTNSFYNAYIMLKEFPDNQFINQTIYYSLYGIAKHKNKESISELLGSYKQYEGEIQQMYHFLIKINKKYQKS